MEGQKTFDHELELRIIFIVMLQTKLSYLLNKTLVEMEPLKLRMWKGFAQGVQCSHYGVKQNPTMNRSGKEMLG